MHKGDIYAITFDDHCEDGQAPIRFTVYGRIIRESKRSVCVCCWEYENKRRQDDNTKRYTIVRSAIISATKLGGIK